MMELGVGLSSLLGWSVICLGLTFLAMMLVRRQRIAKYVNRFPGPPTRFLLGNAWELNVPHEDFWKTISGLVAQHYPSPLSRIWIGLRPYVFFLKPEYLEPLLSSNKFIDKAADYELLLPWLGRGLLISTGNRWHSRRKLLTPTFHFRILDDFMSVFHEQSQILVKRLDGEVGKQSFNIYPYVTLCALDIICDTAMGLSINAQGNEESEYVKSIYALGEIFQKRLVNPILKNDTIFEFTPTGRKQKKCLEIVHGFASKVIAERKQLYAKNGKSVQDSTDVSKRRLAFLDLLIEASDDGKVLSDLDIREEVDTFMFEGHDTTAAGMNWTLHCLGKNPDMQQKVRDELDAIFHESDRAPTANDLKEMKYLECAIKESLRLFPSVPMFGRQLKETFSYDGIEIPAGTTCSIIPFLLHRDPALYPDPEKFDPDRFLPENSVNRHPYAYLPFSAGPRNCIGQKFALMEEKVVLSAVLRNFVVTSLDKTEELKLLSEPILRPHTGFQMRLERRAQVTHL